MPFTAIPGSPGAMPGLIAPGIATTFVPAPFGFSVNTISSREILVRFPIPVNLLTRDDPNSALTLANYTLAVGSNPALSLISVRESGTHPFSVILTVNGYLKYNTTYTLSMVGVRSADGLSGVSSNGVNFKATVLAPPIPLGAFFSIENHIDVVFDRDLSTSISPAANISGSALNFSNVTGNRLRYSLPAVLSTSGGWEISITSDVTDVWGNTYLSALSGTVNIPIKPHPSFDFNNYSDFQILDMVLLPNTPAVIPSGGCKTLRVYCSNSVGSVNIPTGSIVGGLTAVNKNACGTSYILSAASNVVTASCDRYIFDVYVTGDLNGTPVTLNITPTNGSPAPYLFTPRSVSDGPAITGLGQNPGEAFLVNFDQSISSMNTVATTTQWTSYAPGTVTTTPTYLILAIVDLWHAFYRHLSVPHNVSQSFTLTPSNLPVDPTLAAVKTSFISLKDIIVGHFQSSYHGGISDPQLSSIPSSLKDLESGQITSFDELASHFSVLVDLFNNHTQNAALHTNSIYPAGTALLTYRGTHNNTFVVPTPGGQLINADYLIQFFGSTSYIDDSGIQIPAGFSGSTSAVGLDDFPQVSAAYPNSGVETLYGDPRLWKDRVEVWYSKSMKPPSDSFLSISGGSITVDSKSWINDRMLKCDVSGMTTTAYTVTSAGSQDLAGNGVQS